MYHFVKPTPQVMKIQCQEGLDHIRSRHNTTHKFDHMAGLNGTQFNMELHLI
jgi:hypothetical protein